MSKTVDLILNSDGSISIIEDKGDRFTLDIDTVEDIYNMVNVSKVSEKFDKEDPLLKGIDFENELIDLVREYIDLRERYLEMIDPVIKEMILLYRENDIFREELESQLARG